MSKCLSTNVHCSTKESTFYIIFINDWEGACLRFPAWVGEMLKDFIFGIQSEALSPIGPQDWFILRNIKKQCSGFTLVINLLSWVIIFICLLLFPPGSKEVLYLRDDSLLWATKGFESHTIEVPFHPPPPIYNHGGSWVLSGGYQWFPKIQPLFPRCPFFKASPWSPWKSLPPRKHLSLVWHPLGCVPFQFPFLMWDKWLRGVWNEELHLAVRCECVETLLLAPHPWVRRGENNQSEQISCVPHKLTC